MPTFAVYERHLNEKRVAKFVKNTNNPAVRCQFCWIV